MTQEQYERESNFQIAFAVFKNLFSQGLLTKEQLATACRKLIERFQPPVSCLCDVLSSDCP